MIDYYKRVPYFAYKVHIMKKFNNENLIEDLKATCKDSFDMRAKPFNEKFETACHKLIKLAVTKVTSCGRYTIPAIEENKNQYMTDIYTFLSFRSVEEAQEELYTVPYIESDYIFNLLEYTFFALVIVDEDIDRRFKTAYELWQNSQEIGVAGFSERENKLLPYYITKFDTRFFLINPITGEIKFFERKGGLRSKYVKGLSVGKEEFKDGRKREVAVALLTNNRFKPLVEISDLGVVTELCPTKKADSDRKAAERAKRREQGYEVEETPWQTVCLGNVDGSEYNIRSHSLICLMVYGIEVMKYGIMECNSIFSVDHINGVHNANGIDNLQLLTRLSNEDKKKNPNGFYFDYFGYWKKQVEASKRNQENLTYRKQI